MDNIKIDRINTLAQARKKCRLTEEEKKREMLSERNILLRSV